MREAACAAAWGRRHCKAENPNRQTTIHAVAHASSNRKESVRDISHTNHKPGIGPKARLTRVRAVAERRARGARAGRPREHRQRRRRACTGTSRPARRGARGRGAPCARRGAAGRIYVFNRNVTRSRGGAGGAAWPALRPNARKRAGGAGAVAGCIAIAAGSVRTATLATGAKRALVEWWGARRPPHARLRARGAGLGWQRKDSPGHRGEAEAAAWAGLPGDGATQPESGPTGANGRYARPGWAREAGTAEAIRGESQASRPPRA